MAPEPAPDELTASQSKTDVQFFQPPSPSDDEEVRKYTSWSDPKNIGLSATPECLKPPGDSTSRTYTSIGNNGTTASISAYGDIMQITKYFGLGKSGFFCVDLPGQSEPWFVEHRAQQLMDYSTDPSQGLGLLIPGTFQGKPRLDFAHDQWPHFQVETDQLFISIRYVIRNGVVLQRYNITPKKNAQEPFLFQFGRDGLLIREMEWLDSWNHFNIGGWNYTDVRYKTIPGWNDLSLNVIHHLDNLDDNGEEHQHSKTGVSECANKQECEGPMSNGGSEDQTAAPVRPRAVGLVMAVFAEGKPQNVGLDGKISVSAPKGFKDLEVTVAYRLQLLNDKDNGWKSSLISASEVCGTPFYPPLSFSPVTFSKNPHVDFSMRRNLEHILSVCSIETAIGFTWNPTSKLFEESSGEGDKSAIALTCGDIAGHHIVSSASFFAFRFLLEMYKFLDNRAAEDTSMESLNQKPKDQPKRESKPTKKGAYISKGILSKNTTHEARGKRTEDMSGKSSSEESRAYCDRQRTRIYKACRGHLNWVFQNAWDRDNPHFGSNHWASGAEIHFPDHWRSDLRSSPSLANIPFQIIKAVEFANCWPKSGVTEQAEISGDAGKHKETDRQVTEDEPPTNPSPSQRPVTAHGVVKQQSEQFPIEETTRDQASGELGYVANENTGNAKEISYPADARKVPESERRTFVQSLLKGKVKPWINNLAKKNKRTQFAFYRSIENGIGNFRLEDHVWIWTALKHLETIGLEEEMKPDHSPLLCTDESGKITSKDAQKNILRRFSLEDTILKQRLLATSRTLRESRFLFRSRDTSLFYGISQEFLNPEQLRASMWVNTIEIQKHHGHNDDSRWENPLRYGLAMVMRSIGSWQINHKMPEKMFSDAAAVLLRSSQSNGLFPGQLDAQSKEPVMFSEQYYRDFYWHVGFELPYIFWVYGRSILDKMPGMRPKVPGKKGGQFGNTPHSSFPGALSHMNILEATAEVGEQNRGDSRMQTMPPPSIQKRARDTQLAIEAFTIKKTMPFNDSIDQNSIIELPDGWLYRFPDFLGFDPEISSEDDVISKVSNRRHDCASSTVLSKAAKMFKQEEEKTLRFTDSDTPPRGAIVDIQKSERTTKGSPSEQNDPEWSLKSNSQMWEVLRKPRTEEKAKRRIIWLPQPDEQTALLCYLACPESQQEAMMDFFDKHCGHEKYFLDDTVAVQNSWETELHVSFYQLLKPARTGARGEIPPQSSIPSSQPKGFGDRTIDRASIGFRFFGDFLDRHWTCHIVEHFPSQGHSVAPIEFGTRNSSSKSGEWKQRKVLELMLVDKMLSEIQNGVETIMNELEIHNQQPYTRSRFTVKDYILSSKRWQSCQYILQILEEDLNENMEQIENWKKREIDRGREKPRWTKNDERKYRGQMNKLLRSNDRKIRKLENWRVRIQSISTQIKNTQDAVRDDLNLLGAEDIKIFTYVTVVFLPLGFAASIFSMSDTPRTDVLFSMAVTAVAALVITIFALISAKVLVGLLSDIGHDLHAILNRITTSSILFQYYHEDNHQPRPSFEDTRTQFKGAYTKWRLQRMFQCLWYCWFWVAYTVQELPGRQYAHACEKLGFMNNDLTKKEETEQTSTKKRHKLQLIRWGSSAFQTAVWILQIPLKLGVLLVIFVTSLLAWTATMLKKLYLALRGPLGFIVAILLVPFFVLSYILNLVSLNMYDVASRINKANQSSTATDFENPDQLAQDPSGNGPSSGGNSKKNAIDQGAQQTLKNGEALKRFLVYSTGTRPFQKQAQEEKKMDDGHVDGAQGSEVNLDVLKVMLDVFGKLPAWPKRRKAVGPPV